MSEDRDSLQKLIDSLFKCEGHVTRLDAIIRAQGLDLHEDLIEIVELLPPIRYTRQQMCDQLNSALNGHGWTRRFLTVD